MKIFVNNQSVEISKDIHTVKDFLSSGKYSGSGTAVALNDNILPKTKWEETALNEGDKLVIISAAFGG